MYGAQDNISRLMVIVWQSIPSFFVIPHSVLTPQARDLADYRWDLIAGKGFSVPLTATVGLGPEGV